MPQVKTAKAKTAKSAPYAKGGKKATASKKTKKVDDAAAVHFEKRPRVFSIGGAVQPKRDMTRFVKWPRYIKLQRQRRVLYARLKVPPAINMFTKTIDKNQASTLLKLLAKYKPEDKSAKKARLLAAAKAKADAKAAGDKSKPATPGKAPAQIKYGINHVTALIEAKKAKLVIIAHDVDPVELVLFLPALCRKNGIPFCIVKGKARLGALVHKKTATAVCLTSVRQEDSQDFGNLCTAFKDKYLEKWDDLRKQWGGGQLGYKSTAALRKRQKAVAKEEKARQAL
jgi:large subunit ribosomal protein L7Ae